MNRKLVLLSQMVAAAALLAACGGGGSDTPVPAPPPPMPGPLDAVPPSASASVQGMVSYLSTLSAQKPEDKEPVDVSGFTPPTSDDTEPQPV
jgi:hypothetical protein